MTDRIRHIVYLDALDMLLRLYVRRRNTATAAGNESKRNERQPSGLRLSGTGGFGAAIRPAGRRGVGVRVSRLRSSPAW